MRRTEQIKKRMQTAGDLKSIVRSMKLIASVNIRHFEQAVESLGTYYQTVEYGLQIVLNKSVDKTQFGVEQSHDQTGLIVFGASQGLCGTFDEVIYSYFSDYFSSKGWEPVRIFSLGERIYDYLLLDYNRPDKQFGLPGSVSGINETVSELLTGIDRWRKEEGISEIILFHNKPKQYGQFIPWEQRLLPLDKHWLNRLTKQPWPTNNIPNFTVKPKVMFSALIRQYLYVSLFRSVAESLAAEYASRLNAMQAAERKIDERISKLEKQFRQERHRGITEELLDIMAGYEVISER